MDEVVVDGGLIDEDDFSDDARIPSVNDFSDVSERGGLAVVAREA